MQQSNCIIVSIYSKLSYSISSSGIGTLAIYEPRDKRGAKVKGFRKRTGSDVNYNTICEKELSDRNTELPESS